MSCFEDLVTNPLVLPDISFNTFTTNTYKSSWDIFMRGMVVGSGIAIPMCNTILLHNAFATTNLYTLKSTHWILSDRTLVQRLMTSHTTKHKAPMQVANHYPLYWVFYYWYSTNDSLAVDHNIVSGGVLYHRILVLHHCSGKIMISGYNYKLYNKRTYPTCLA